MYSSVNRSQAAAKSPLDDGLDVVLVDLPHLLLVTLPTAAPRAAIATAQASTVNSALDLPHFGVHGREAMRLL